MTPGPGRRQCTAYLRPGPGGMPLALPLSEGLGSTRAIAASLAAPRSFSRPAPGIPAPRWRPWQATHSSRRCRWPGWTRRGWPRRPDELIENLRFLRSSARRCGTARPCHCLRPPFNRRPVQIPRIPAPLHSAEGRCHAHHFADNCLLAALPPCGCSTHAEGADSAGALHGLDCDA